MENEKQKLLEEKKILEGELKNLGIEDPQNHDWGAVPYKLADEDKSDPIDTADRMEDFGERSALLGELEIRYRDICDKLKEMG